MKRSGVQPIRYWLALCWALLFTTSAWPGPPSATKAVLSDYVSVVDEPLQRGTCYVNATINGHELTLLVDTGFGLELLLTEEASAKLGLQLRPSDLERIAGSADVVFETAESGPESPTLAVQAFVYDFPGKAPFDGILGWKLLRHAVWEFDYPGKRHAFHGELPGEVREQWVSFPLDQQHVGGNLAITVPVDGFDRKVIVDTGASVGLALNANLWRKWLTEHQPRWLTVQAGMSPGTAGMIHVTPVAVDDNARIGDFELGKVVVTKSFFEVNLGGDRINLPYVIGTDALRHRRVFFDGPGQRVYFGPLGGANGELPVINRAQATFAPTEVESGLLMAYVLEGGVAHRAGLRDGDRLLEIDGVDKREWYKSFNKGKRNSFEAGPGTRVKVLVLREGEQREIEVTLGRSPLDDDAPGEGP
ncbi:MAG: aspartyl protease family protein [Phycisphaeraceae bacterium]